MATLIRSLRSSNLTQFLGKQLNQGYTPYIFAFIYMLLGAMWVYFNPTSLLAFFFFLSSALVLFSLKINTTAKVVLFVIMALILVPILGARNTYYLEIFFLICIFSALSLGLNIVVGFAGLLDLGYVAFYAVGAYLWAFFGSQQPFLLHSIPGSTQPGTPFFLPADYFYLFIFLGIIAAGVVGILLGLPVLRVRGDYLAIVTLGFGELIRVLANNLDKPLNLTNGPQGITPIQQPTLPQPLMDGLNSVFATVVGHKIAQGDFYKLFFYFLALIIIVFIIIVTRRLDDSKIGRAWTAIREDETAAIAMGVPLVKMKLAAFAAGASFAGVMGVLFSAKQIFISPESFNFMQSIGVLTMVILGGLGSIPGVIVGAAAVVILNNQVLQSLSLTLSALRQSDAVIPIINFAWKDLSNQLDPAKYQRLLFGIILILMMIYRPGGLIPAARRKREMSTPKEEKSSDTTPIEVSTAEVQDGAA